MRGVSNPAAWVVAGALCATAVYGRPTAPAIDASDLWLAADEDGWGLSAVHQADVVFLAFLVYGRDGSPVWYTASALQSADTEQAYSGALYQTSGPWFGADWAPAAVGYRQVGTATFTLAAANDARVTYVVDNISVTKTLHRHTFRATSATGSYLGAIAWSSGTQCVAHALTGPVSFAIASDGGSTSISIVERSTGYDCGYHGAHTQNGRMGRIRGDCLCFDLGAGTFEISELEVTDSGFTGKLSQSLANCRWEGRIAGARLDD